MPLEYVTRIVFDRHHRTLALMKGNKVLFMSFTVLATRSLFHFAFFTLFVDSRLLEASAIGASGRWASWRWFSVPSAPTYS
jgi:hypothetical protein